MLLERFYDDTLAQASYLVGCQATGEALVIDANRNVEQYMEKARAEKFRIAHVTETHIHADFVSGSRELAQRTGAQLYLSAEGGEDWQYEFGGEAGVTLLHDGDEIRVGNVLLRVMHTPGHTPEHLSFLLTDGAASDRPMGVFTGDFVFVGDVGRPDLLERAAGHQDTMDASARTLHRSLQGFRELPDWLQIWPGHGAGSACGKALGAVPSSTLGYEKLVNWGLSGLSEEAFVESVLAGQPEPPAYFADMKRINREGPAPRYDAIAPTRMDAGALDAVLGQPGSIVVDMRSAAVVAGSYIPGTINVPYGKKFSTWVGTIVPIDSAVYLVAVDPDGESARSATNDLALIGYDSVTGWFPPDVVQEWAERTGNSVESIGQVPAAEMDSMVAAGEVAVLDVRGRSEYEAGHVPGVPNIPLQELARRLDEVPDDRPVVVHCQGGSRSAISASLLRRVGKDASNVVGGYEAWREAGVREGLG